MNKLEQIKIIEDKFLNLHNDVGNEVSFIFLRYAELKSKLNELSNLILELKLEEQKNEGSINP